MPTTKDAYKLVLSWSWGGETLRTICLEEIIVRLSLSAESVFYSIICFSLATNQPAVLSVMTYLHFDSITYSLIFAKPTARRGGESTARILASALQV